MLDKIKKLIYKPALYEKSTSEFWRDLYISKQMLKAHLDSEFEGATRNHTFVKKSVDWIADMLPSERYPKLLDLGCGPGIYAELFAQKGCQITGIDMSANSINYAVKKAEQSKSNIRYMERNYVEDQIDGLYDVIILIYCDFGVLAPEERKIVLKKVYDALKPGGCFLMDVFTPAAYDGLEEYTRWNYEKGGFWSEEDYLELYSFYRYEEDSTFLEQNIIITEEKVVHYNLWNHAFTVTELKEDLKAAGFESVELYGDVTGRTYTEKSETICVIAEKE